MKKVSVMLSLVCLVFIQAFSIVPKDSALKQVAKTIDSSGLSKALDKLDPDQIVDVIKSMNHENAGKDDVHLNVNVVSLAPFIMPILIILIVFLVKAYNTRQKTKLAMLCVEKGQAMPTDFFKEKGTKRRSNLQRGIIFISLGMGLFICLYILQGIKIASVSLIPLFMGLGYVIIHYLDNNNGNESSNKIDAK